MRNLIILLLCCLVGSAKGQTLPLSELMHLATLSPDSLNHRLTAAGWEHMAGDTIWAAKGEPFLRYNAKWGYKLPGDTMPKLWLYYEKKQNTVTAAKGYFENIQYSFACLPCYHELLDSIHQTQWIRTQDDHTEEKTMQTYDAGDYSVMLVRHFKKQLEWYDVVVFRKEPVH